MTQSLPILSRIPTACQLFSYYLNPSTRFLKLSNPPFDIKILETFSYENLISGNALVASPGLKIDFSDRNVDAKPTSVSISKDGDRIAVGAGKLYLLNKQGELLWSQSEVEPNYNDGGYFRAKSVIITDDGEYIAVVHGSRDLYFYNQQYQLPIFLL